MPEYKFPTWKCFSLSCLVDRWMKESRNPHTSTLNDQIGRRKRRKRGLFRLSSSASLAILHLQIQRSYCLDNHLSHRGQKLEIMAKERTDASPVAHRQTAGDTSAAIKGIQDGNVMRRTRRRDDTGAPEGPA